ncbi:D(2) dopamine receptor A [Holothuria leucospilota]|uniref:D(2) dopamine receptor A n=1 Tax=Holothuria leucospilota TaxID=206669 RepID=A0A9Q0YT66_HOLLE|nr:D(2) dopamine receptor A [Holothuria leucospilota]
MNDSSSEVDEDFEMSSINVIFVIVLPVICVIGLAGNLLVCVAIIRFPHLRTVTNYLLVSLAVADSAVCLIIMPFAAFQEINSGKWLLGRALCDIWVGMDVLMCTASIWNLCAVSVDRYLAVSRPIWYAMKRKPSFAALLISVSWVLSILVCIPALLFVGGFDSSDEDICILNVQPLFQIISSAVSFYIPCIFIVLLYIRIAHAAQKLTSSVQPDGTVRGARSNRRFPDEKTFDAPSETVDYPTNRSSVRINNTVVPLGFQNPLCAVTESEELSLENRPEGNDFGRPKLHIVNPSVNLPSVSGKSVAQNFVEEARAAPSYQTIDLHEPTGSTVSSLYGRGSNVQNRRSKSKRIKISVTREKRATLVIGIVVGVFISCWLPFFVVNVVLGICPSTCQVSYAAFQFVTWLGWCNSVLNPVIYTIFNRELRTAFGKILLCKR